MATSSLKTWEKCAPLPIKSEEHSIMIYSDEKVGLAMYVGSRIFLYNITTDAWLDIGSNPISTYIGNYQMTEGTSGVFHPFGKRITAQSGGSITSTVLSLGSSPLLTKVVKSNQHSMLSQLGNNHFVVRIVDNSGSASSADTYLNSIIGFSGGENSDIHLDAGGTYYGASEIQDGAVLDLYTGAFYIFATVSGVHYFSKFDVLTMTWDTTFPSTATIPATFADTFYNPPAGDPVPAIFTSMVAPFDYGKIGYFTKLTNPQGGTTSSVYVNDVDFKTGGVLSLSTNSLVGCIVRGSYENTNNKATTHFIVSNTLNSVTVSPAAASSFSTGTYYLECFQNYIYLVGVELDVYRYNINTATWSVLPKNADRATANLGNSYIYYLKNLIAVNGQNQESRAFYIAANTGSNFHIQKYDKTTLNWNTKNIINTICSGEERISFASHGYQHPIVVYNLNVGSYPTISKIKTIEGTLEPVANLPFKIKSALKTHGLFLTDQGTLDNYVYYLMPGSENMYRYKL